MGATPINACKKFGHREAFVTGTKSMFVCVMARAAWGDSFRVISEVCGNPLLWDPCAHNHLQFAHYNRITLASCSQPSCSPIHLALYPGPL